MIKQIFIIIFLLTQSSQAFAAEKLPNYDSPIVLPSCEKMYASNFPSSLDAAGIVDISEFQHDVKLFNKSLKYWTQEDFKIFSGLLKLCRSEFSRAKFGKEVSDTEYNQWAKNRFELVVKQYLQKKPQGDREKECFRFVEKIQALQTRQVLIKFLKEKLSKEDIDALEKTKQLVNSSKNSTFYSICKVPSDIENIDLVIQKAQISNAITDQLSELENLSTKVDQVQKGEEGLVELDKYSDELETSIQNLESMFEAYNKVPKISIFHDEPLNITQSYTAELVDGIAQKIDNTSNKINSAKQEINNALIQEKINAAKPLCNTFSKNIESSGALGIIEKSKSSILSKEDVSILEKIESLFAIESKKDYFSYCKVSNYIDEISAILKFNELSYKMKPFIEECEQCKNKVEDLDLNKSGYRELSTLDAVKNKFMSGSSSLTATLRSLEHRGKYTSEIAFKSDTQMSNCFTSLGEAFRIKRSAIEEALIDAECKSICDDKGIDEDILNYIIAGQNNDFIYFSSLACSSIIAHKFTAFDEPSMFGGDDFLLKLNDSTLFFKKNTVGSQNSFTLIKSTSGLDSITFNNTSESSRYLINLLNTWADNKSQYFDNYLKKLRTPK